MSRSNPVYSMRRVWNRWRRLAEMHWSRILELLHKLRPHVMATPSQVTKQAAGWFLRLTANDLSAADRREYLAWLKASSVHVEELLDIYRCHGYGRKLRLTQDPLESPQRHERATVLPPSAYLPTDQWLHAAVVTQVRPVSEGLIVQANPVEFAALVRHLERDPSLAHQIHWRKWEELVAAAYEREGFEVILTPRSNDQGRDIIATRADIGTIRIFDQVKALSPNRLVTASDVLAMLGVLYAEPNVSKAFITTTADFAPGVYANPRLRQLMPYRLELRPRPPLLAWLSKVRSI